MMSKKRFRFFTILTLCFLCIGAGTAFAATISGTVRDSNNAPVTTNGWVTAYSGDPCGTRTSVANSSINITNGTYSITGLSADTYFLYADSNGNHIGEWLANSESSPECGAAKAVIVGDTDTLTGQDFKLDPAVTISGTVADINGPTDDAYIGVFTGNSCNPIYVGGNWVESNGSYTISKLPADTTYYLKAYYSSNHVSEWWASGSGGSLDCLSAESVPVVAGMTPTPKNFVLEIGASISGTVTDSQGAAITNGVVMAYTDPCNDNWVSYAWLDQTGMYTISDLTPGTTYYLSAYSYGNHVAEWWTHDNGTLICGNAEGVAAVAEPTTGKDFVLATGAQIKGTASDINGPVTEGRVTAYSGDPCGNYSWIGSADLQSDGTYTIQGLSTGSYFLKAEPNGYDVSAWWTNGGGSPVCGEAQTVSATEGVITDNKDFQLEIGGKITGAVEDSNNAVITSGYVDVFTGNPCGQFEQIQRADLDSNGIYVANGLPAGTDYYLQARSNDAHIAEWSAGSTSNPDCHSAQAVTVTAGETTTGKDFQLDLGGTITGTVKDSGDVVITSGYVDVFTGNPCGQFEQIQRADLDSNGIYIASGLPAGTGYYLQAHSNGAHIAEWWAGSTSNPDCHSAQTVTVTAGETTTDKNFQLDLGGTISGTVKDSNNAVITSGYVDVFTGNPCGQFEQIQRADLDSNGSYITSGLPAGTDYYLQARSNDAHIAEWSAGSTSNPDCHSAQTVTVTAGETTTGKDFQLDLGGTISGTVKDSNNVAIASGYVDVFTGNPCEYHFIEHAELDSNGSYTTNGIPAGTAYYLKASSNGAYISEWWNAGGSTPDCNSAQPVTITAGGTTTGKDFQLDLGGTISGTVKDSNNVAIASGHVEVYTGSACGHPNYLGNAELDSNGSYTTNGIPAGTAYYLKASSNGAYISEWWNAGGSTSDCNLAQAVTVTVGNETTGKDFQLDLGGMISGTVKDSNNVAIASGYVDVFTGNTCGQLNHIEHAELDSNGSYTTNGIPAGTAYYLKAESAGAYISEWWKDGGSTSDCNLAQAVTVTVGNETTGKDFQLDDSTGVTYTVTTSANPAAGGTVTGGGTYNAGATATLTAIPAAGYAFTGWSGSITGATNPIDVTNILANKNVVANFAQTYTVTTSANPVAGGSVTGGGSYNSGATATLTATPAPGYAFTGWSGDATGVTTTIEVTDITANKNITANFTQTYTVTTSANPVAGGTVTGGGTYNSGATATLTANPAPGYAFTNWSGDATGATTTIEVTNITSNMDIIANFMPTTKKKRILFPIRAKDGQTVILSL